MLPLQDLAVDWRASHEWVNPDGSIAVDALESDLGSAKIWATDVSQCVG